MFTVLYKWRLKPRLEQQFIDAWSEITVYYRENAGSFGSRLHHGDDGLWYAYAQWPSDDHRRNAFESTPAHPARDKMKEAIEESFDEIHLEIAADHLKSGE
jgi:2-polyprenyl-6-methoxyphenol hydroxylase-like FAD-dependent oxidoreductase